MEKNWRIKPKGNHKDIKKIQQVLGVPETIANLLVQRGIKNFEQAKSFFRPDLNDLHDPFLMKNMQKAVKRLESAIEKKEKILVYGDYDVDGTTSVALVYSFLKNFYPHLDYYVPDRYTEGYGISFKGIDYAYSREQTLIIALDCGIKAKKQIDYAAQKGIDFIICDHHTPGETIPNAVAVLDPKRRDCTYPFKELSGCGVGFKLLQAYSQKQQIPFERLTAFIDLVAVSIASDIVPIVGENRILAFYGLKKLNENPLTGLRSIINIAGIQDKEIVISDCVFKIGPRINAAGRIESGRQAVKLLISDNTTAAQTFSESVNELNITRKDLDYQITQECLQTISEDKKLLKRKSTVLFNNSWHKGVIGIVASRIIETYYRPTIILTESKGLATGSARSVQGFNLYEAIDACGDLLENYGGHTFAAGLSLKIENLPAFTQRFEQEVAARITPEQLVPTINIDAKLNFDHVTPKFYRLLRQFAPFGPGNMSPVFMTENVKDAGSSRIVGNTQEHLKLALVQNNKIMNGIAFSQANHLEVVKSEEEFNICYAVDKNEFRGITTLQLMVKDIQKSNP